MRRNADLARRQQPGGPPTSPSENDHTPTASNNPTGTSTPSPSTSSSTSSGSHGSPTGIIAVVASLVGVTAIILGFFILRRIRQKHKNPKYIPTAFLKKRWEDWEPKEHRYRLPDTNESLEPISSRVAGLRPAGRSSVPPSSFDTTARTAVENAAAGVDRNTSVRSVMTLPAYNQHARESEQVLAREGERGGIDVVIEFPEGTDEEEARREDEMEALYQVRLARRRENEEREERRRLRREARERGDYVALREIQARARATSNVNAGRTVDELRAEHERIKKERQRAVSSVSYADLGVARHDGTRLRANSVESEQDGLLGDAASIAASSHYHRRDRSASSVLSIDTMNSDLPSPGLTRSRANSRAESSLRRVSTSREEGSGSNGGRAGSSPEIIGQEDVPPHSPPGYENISLDTPQDALRREAPPDYSSPITGRGEGNFIGEEPSLLGRRVSASHLDRQRNDSSGSLPPAQPAGSSDSRRSFRGVGDSPQLPSLRFAHLPSIQVDSPTPVRRNEDSETRHTDE